MGHAPRPGFIVITCTQRLRQYCANTVCQMLNVETCHRDVTAEITGVDQSQKPHVGWDQSYLKAQVHLWACPNWELLCLG